MSTGNYKKFEKEIISDYQAGNSIAFLIKKYHVDIVSVKKLLVKNNISEHPIGKRLYPINEDFFREINSHEKAYFLGYLWADGNNRRQLHENGSTVSCSVRMELSCIDKYILEYFRKLIFPKNSAQLSRRINDGRSYFTLSMNSKVMSNDLLDHGMNGQKSLYSKIPKLDDKYINSFTLGFFDGDGSISPKINSNNYNVTIVSEQNIITDLCDTIFRLTGIKFHIGQCPNKISYRMIISNMKDIYSFYKFIYKDQKMFLERKHIKFIQYFNKNKNLFRKTLLNYHGIYDLTDKGKKNRVLVDKPPVAR